jgi:uncharacterized protein (DUF433 family)
MDAGRQDGWLMARKKVLRFDGDVREHPRYSYEEAADILRIPTSTVNAWCRGQHYKHARSRKMIHFSPVIVPASAPDGLLSFYNLAEAHVLRATRERNVPMRNVRRALDYIREHLPATDNPLRNHPLLTHDFLTFGKDLFIEHLGSTINATAHGQIAMRELLEQYLHRIDRDDMGMPIQIRPMNTTYLVINPTISSGQLILKGTRIAAAVLAARKKAGESYHDLAQDYRLTESQIEHAITEYAA